MLPGVHKVAPSNVGLSSSEPKLARHWISHPSGLAKETKSQSRTCFTWQKKNRKHMLCPKKMHVLAVGKWM